jgi:malate synthase
MNSSTLSAEGLVIKVRMKPEYEKILTNEALDFYINLHRKFSNKRLELLANREERQKEIDKGVFPTFLSETASIRDASWEVAPIPEDLQDRRTEITGPVDRKMIINALNSGARVFMADFEDSTSPTWDNIIQGQINLKDAIRRQIDFTAENGKTYSLEENVAVLKVRPRGWHLEEKNIQVDGKYASASIFDFAMYFFHNAKELVANGSGPYFYLPKLESHIEARLWNEIFVEAQNLLNIPQQTIKATVLIETILAALEMEEIIYELRDHMAGLNAGRWDYIFSIIKKFRNFSQFVLPDRVQVSMTVPFMSAYTDLLVMTCHKRGAHAIGGMSAFIPSRKDEDVNKNAFKKVKADKDLEAAKGFDGTWVAHPDLVVLAGDSFYNVLKDKKHQKDVMREDVKVAAEDLLNFKIEKGQITEDGVRLNINVGILYLESWLSGSGAAAIYNLMEDAATAEISRAQLWQWIHNRGISLNDGREMTAELYKQLHEEEMDKIRDLVGEDRFRKGKFELASRLFDSLVLDNDFCEFLTLKAYPYI